MNARMLYLICIVKCIYRLKRLTTGLQARLLITEESLSDTEKHPIINQYNKRLDIVSIYKPRVGGPPGDPTTAHRLDQSSTLPRSVVRCHNSNTTQKLDARTKTEEGRRRGWMEKRVAQLTSED